MAKMPRRAFCKAAVWGLAGLAPSASKARASGVPPGAVTKRALIHATDLFRPHADPDDHFDLACAFSLAVQGLVELRAVLIDHPPADFGRDPDVLALAQLNRITGMAVSVLTGSPRPLDPSEAFRPENRAAAAGARGLLEILRRSDRPVAITIVGSSRDVALAGRLEPGLFADKCAGVYLNAGSGTPDRAKAARLEYNVGLDPASYAAIFDLPCPLYWLPCFEVAPGGGVGMAVAEFGTYYSFLQKNVLPRLSDRLQNYFAFMFKQGESDRDHQAEADALRPNWLRYLEGPREESLLERQGRRFRNMWSTAGFLHLAGLTVSADGEVMPTGAVSSPVYMFDPIRVRCGADGVTAWSPDAASRNRFIFRVRDKERYPSAMTAALAWLLRALDPPPSA
jgi:hypothetical protein